MINLIIIDNIHIQIKFDGMNSKSEQYMLSKIHETLDPLDPNRYRKRAFLTYNSSGTRIWDGRIKLCDFTNPNKLLIPIGLYDDLIKVLNEIGYREGANYKVQDQRQAPYKVTLPDSITLDGHGEEKTLTLRDYQYQSVVNAFREQSGILLEATNSGKCLEKSTRLYTNKGILTIGELLESSGVNTKDTTPRVIDYHGNVKLTNRNGNLERPSKLVVNGVKPVYEIQTEIGNSIRITGNNPVLVVDAKGFTWKRVDELRVGDLLVSRLGSNFYGNNSKFSKVDAYSLGLMVADGCYHNATFNFTNNEPVLIDYINKWFTKLTGISPRIDKRIINGNYSCSEINIRVGKASHSYVVSNKKKLKQQLELGNDLAGTKEIPNSILAAPKDIQLAFLSGYFECEMNYNMTGGRLGIEITSKSQKLILQVQLMLINMGVLSKIRDRKVKGYFSTYYVLEFRAIDGFNLLNLLSFKTDSRQTQKENYITIFNMKHRNPKGRFVPNGKQLFHEYYKSLSLEDRVKAHHVGYIPDTISKYRAIKLLKKLPNGDSSIKKKILEKANLKDFFVKVKKIEVIGKKPTFDVEMPISHSLLANGIVVHNSVVSISIYKYLLNKINNNEHLLFIAPNSSIMNQLYDKFRHYLGNNNVGAWGDGKKDLNKPIVVATIQTIASAIKKPKDKLTRKKDRLIERIATKYAPAIMQSGSPKANLKLLAMNFKPKYKYEADDVDMLRNMAVSYDTDQDVIGAMKAYQKKYKHLVYKLNQKGFDKYYSAIDFLHSVVAVICDEAHFAGAMSYWNVFQYLTNARMRIGMTGTLDNSKKIHMARIKSLLGVPIINVTNKQMIDRGVSAKPYIKLVPIDKPVNLEQQVGAIAQRQGVIGGSTADLMLYQIAYKIGVVQNKYRNNLIAQLAIATAKRLNKQAVLIIVNSIEQGENICAELDQYQAEYAFIQGKDDSDTREEALQRVRNGELKILIGTKIIDTGIDVDAFKALILCSAGKSYISLLQRIGRILRIRKDKRKVIIFDLFDRTSKILYKHGKQRVKYYKEQGFDVS